MHTCPTTSATASAKADVALCGAFCQNSPVRFECDALIALTDTPVITKQTAVDAMGGSVTLSGGGSIRLSDVEPVLNEMTAGCSLLKIWCQKAIPWYTAA